MDAFNLTTWGRTKQFSRRNWLTLLVLVLALGVLGSKRLSATEAILVGAGDIAKCGENLKGAEATANILDQLFPGSGGSQRDGVVFTLGDNTYPRGTALQFSECYHPTWGRHKGRTRPALGNHDYGVKGGGAYFDYFGEAAGERGKGYYSYDLSDWHIIVLNSNCKKVGGCEAGSPQHQWLVDDLEKHPRPCTLAYWHHPLFSSGKHGGKKGMRPVFKTLYDFDVDVVLAGHEHNYERFAPQDPDGLLDPDRGVRQFVVGTGGREHRRLKQPKPNSEVRENATFGVLKLMLHPESYDWEFIPVAGASFVDSGSTKCH